jgi:hypothetical protein
MTREELYELVWSQPMTEVAKRLGVSGSYMARVCTQLAVPRPQLGYWAKHAVGKAPPKPPLPAAHPGDQISWIKGDTLPLLHRPSDNRRIPTHATQQSSKEVHFLLNGVKSLFESGWPTKDDELLKPRKKLLVDITATKTGLDQAILLADDLFKALESAGHRVMLSTANGHRPTPNVHEQPTKTNDIWENSRFWSPQRSTVVYVREVAIGLSIIEMTENVLMRYIRGKYIRESDYIEPRRTRGYVDHSWTTTRELPTGRYRIVAYSTSHLVNYSMSWQDMKDKRLSIKDIIDKLQPFIAEFLIRLESARKQEDIRQQKWKEEQERYRKEDDKRQTEKSIQDSSDELKILMQDWDYTLRVEEFFKGVEKRVQSPEIPEARRQEILTRLKLAREFLGTQDPLDFLMSWRMPLERYQPKYTE